MRFITPVLLAGIFLLQGVLEPVQAQTRSDDYRYANELMRQGEYERAFELFYEMLQEEPESHPIYDNAIEALIHMRDFEKAIEITNERLSIQPDDVNTQIQLGELYHYNGEREKAREVWKDIVRAHAEDIRIYRQVARAMRDRRDYEGAIEVYEMGREERNNPTLFTNELAQAYLADSRYEEAMSEFLELIQQNRHYTHSIKRQLMRYEERELYDVAILETEEAVDEHRTDYDTANIYRNLLIWLYTERELYDRALATAKSVERYQGEHTEYAVFDLARNLRGEHEFELAEEAYQHYIDQEEHDMRSRSMEELAQTYQHWARHLTSTNQAYPNRLKPLYEQASATLEKLIDDYPAYDRMGQILVLQSELALDHLNDTEKARKYADQLASMAGSDEMEAYHYFLEGRIKIFEGEFARARVALTRSNRMFNIGEMAEQTNYYLSLCDFFNGDFEYARMQLRRLERQHTSFYANDALQLRLWIQEGVHQDEPLPALELFAKARHALHIGDDETAGRNLQELLREHQQSPLNTEALLSSVNLLARISPAASYAIIDYVPFDNLNPSTKEQVMWEKARLAHHIYQDDYDFEDELQLANETLENLFPAIAGEINAGIPEGIAEIIELYEELLIQYPHGFYASSARAKIRELEDQQQAS